MLVKMIYKAYKYRLYPTIEQESLLLKHFGCVRFVYNWGLEQKIKQYQINKKKLNKFDIIKMLVKLKTEYKWLREVNAQSLQQAIRNLDRAFTKFFEEGAGFPKFKTRKSKQSFSCPQGCKIDLKGSLLKIPKVFDIPIVLHREFKGEVKTVTISRSLCGKYFASILINVEEIFPHKPPIQDQTTVGIDLGLNNFATLSNGEKICNPRYLKKSLDRLQTIQHQLSKKSKNSKRREKTRRRLAIVNERVANQRNDFLHKLSYDLTHKSQVESLVIESLEVNNMQKNHILAQSIGDAGWNRFVEFLRYKCEWYGKNLIKIGKFCPTSKQCICGVINKNLTLNDRQWICKDCGRHHDRDILASQNIKGFGLIQNSLIGQELPESTLMETALLKASMN